jgi:hypothetical protein
MGGPARKKRMQLILILPREYSPQPYGIGNTCYGSHEGSTAHFDLPLLAELPDPLEVALHDVKEPGVVLFAGPEVTTEVLGPFEVGTDNAAGVGEEIGNDKDALGVENGVGLRGYRTVGSLDDVPGLYLVGVVLVNRTLKSCGNEDISVEEEKLLCVDLSRPGCLYPSSSLWGCSRCAGKTC